MKNTKQKFIDLAYSKFGIKVNESINFEQAFEILDEIEQLTTPAVSVLVESSDVGKCTKCKFNINDRCTVGTYYAKQGKSRFCIEGELWEAN